VLVIQPGVHRESLDGSVGAATWTPSQ